MRLEDLIPAPHSAFSMDGGFLLGPETRIHLPAGDPEIARVGGMLREYLERLSGMSLPVLASHGDPGGSIRLCLDPSDSSLGREGYLLAMSAEGIRLSSGTAEGLFRGTQTLRLLAERAGAGSGVWFPAGRIKDLPRYDWRGAMLDVARHFFPVQEVKRVIDLLALYKLNRLHLHLTDDQGWRIDIPSWPRLTRTGATTAVGGGPGGFYTLADYADIVAYAREHFITVVPEVDLPGHTQAAIASYPELSPGARSTALYTGIDVGFSSLDLAAASTSRFLEEVLGQVAAVTPGDWIHVGGDEADKTDSNDYVHFMLALSRIVDALGKQLIGWEEIARVPLRTPHLIQVWKNPAGLLPALERGARVILSPSTRAYLDMKYHPEFPLGLAWAGTTEVPESYGWDPAEHLPGLDETSIAGVEATLWTETLETFEDLSLMLLPRLPGIAETGWSRRECRCWSDGKHRLAAHAQLWDRCGWPFYRSPTVPWTPVREQPLQTSCSPLAGSSTLLP